jgi:prepilin-type N-terminal cleavage/methylation domain-containing protein
MKTKGFTLIELLIVVAIIAILAAIAVPNFLEAQLRSKVARVRSDMRTVSIALESYATDNAKYPAITGYGPNYLIKEGDGQSLCTRGGIFNCLLLSTPIAYLTTTRMPDPFVKSQAYDAVGDSQGADLKANGGNYSYTFNYINTVLYYQLNPKNFGPYDGRPKYYLLSLGPDCRKGPNPYNSATATLNDYLCKDYTKWDASHNYDVWNYDPSNGTVSGGDVIRHP